MNLSSTKIKNLEVRKEVVKNAILIRSSKIITVAFVAGISLYMSKDGLIDVISTIMQQDNNYLYEQIDKVMELGSVAVPAVILYLGSLYNKEDLKEYREINQKIKR